MSISILRLVQIRMKLMDYENDLELCEYNPVSVQYENELRMLAKIVETPAMSFFQKLMKKIIFAHGIEA